MQSTRAEIRHHFALGDMDCNNHTEMGEQVCIYTYIMHNASTQCRKVNAYIPRAQIISAGK